MPNSPPFYCCCCRSVTRSPCARLVLGKDILESLPWKAPFVSDRFPISVRYTSDQNELNQPVNRPIGPEPKLPLILSEHRPTACQCIRNPGSVFRHCILRVSTDFPQPPFAPGRVLSGSNRAGQGRRSCRRSSARTSRSVARSRLALHSQPSRSQRVRRFFFALEIEAFRRRKGSRKSLLSVLAAPPKTLEQH